MKNNLKYRLSALLFLASALTMTSCSDWTDVESLQLNTPTFEEQNPQLYADYLKDLNRYKSEEHKITFVSFENPQGSPGKQAERLTVVPDSVDFICLNNPEVSPEVQAEMVKIREKGTRTIYSIDYSSIENAWKEKVKAEPELTEEDALQYIGERTNEMLALCDKYNFDGIIADYTGRSLVSLKGEELEVYTSRQTNFLNKLKEWKQASNKSLLFYTNVQYLTAENQGIIGLADYIILKTALSTNGDDLSVKALLAVQAGEDAKELYEGINPVPADRLHQLLNCRFGQDYSVRLLPPFDFGSEVDWIRSCPAAALFVRCHRRCFGLVEIPFAARPDFDFVVAADFAVGFVAAVV